VYWTGISIFKPRCGQQYTPRFLLSDRSGAVVPLQEWTDLSPVIISGSSAARKLQFSEMQVCSLLHLSRVIRQRGAGSNRIKPWYLRVKVTAPFTV
jgi:hypothetical protein